MKLLIAALLATLLPLAAIAQAPDCRSGESFASAQADIDRALAALDESQPLPRLKAKLTALGWPSARQSDSLRKVFSSKTLVTLQNEEHVYISALSEAVVASSGPDPRVSKCDAAKKVKSLARKIMALNSRQYDYAAREIGLTGSGAK